MTEHGWTRHGHRCCDQTTGPRPGRTARCGGPVLCPECAADAAVRHAPASGTIRQPEPSPISPSEDVYSAAAHALAANHDGEFPAWDEVADARKVVDAVWPLIRSAGVAAGRAQAAADILAAAANDPVPSAKLSSYALWAAKIAGGEPRG